MLMTIMAFLVGIEHIGIMLLEMFASPAKQAQAFDLPVEYTKQPAARVSFANQGIYNGALGVAIMVSFALFQGGALITAVRLLLTFVIVVAVYGGFTATKKVWLLQLLPAALALLCTF